MRAPAPWTIAPLVLAVALGLYDSSAQAQLSQIPQFRAGVTLVPVEVRVVDRDGNPVRDLTKADFIVREAGALQDVAHLESFDAET